MFKSSNNDFADEHDANPQLLVEAKQIAWEFLERSGEIDDPGEISQFLTGKLEHMIAQG